MKRGKIEIMQQFFPTIFFGHENHANEATILKYFRQKFTRKFQK